MYNYHDFNADYPRDRAVRKFLLADYFHDSKLNVVEYNQSCAELVIRMQCCRDWEDSGKGTMNDEAYCYILRFLGVAGFRYYTDATWAEYINGRFKKTTWLLDKQKNTKQALYQFRIGLADGYIDIIFHSFQIRKAKGRISYRDICDLEDFYPEYCRKPSEQTRILCAELWRSGNDSMMDDLRLEQLYANGAEELPSLCREILTQNRDEDAKAYAAWLLGKCGIPSDKALIWRTYHKMTDQSTFEVRNKNAMLDRNYLDAVESLTKKERDPSAVL